MQDLIREQIEDSILIKQRISTDREILSILAMVTVRCVAALRKGDKILFAGNGGSASDAQHIAAELVGRFCKDRPALAAIALTTDTSALTAIANDYGYAAVFKRQIQSLGREGDVFFGISTSGNSENIVQAVVECKRLGITTIGLTGASGGTLKSMCDHCVMVPSSNTARIQESHIMIGHIICAGIEAELFSSTDTKNSGQRKE